MSANQWIICGKCREYVEKKLKDSYGKITEEKYKLFKSWVDNYDEEPNDELKEILNELDINIHSNHWEAEYSSEFECAYDYGYGTVIDKEGNLCFQYSGTCDCCGINHNIELILPEGVTDSSNFKLDLRGINLKKLKEFLKSHKELSK